jgi:hypothetical protein
VRAGVKYKFSSTRHLTPALSPNSVGGEGEFFAVSLKIRAIKNAASVSEGRFELISLLQP